MSDLISQDELDALLGGALGGGGGGSFSAQPSATAVLDNKSRDAAMDIVECYKEHFKSTTTLNFTRDVSLEIDEFDVVTSSKLEEKIEGEYIIVDASFTGACQGSVRIMGSTQTFATFADLMVAGDGTAPYSESEHKDAVLELFSQISGAFATELGTKFQGSVSASAPTIFTNAGSDLLENDHAAFCTVTMDNFAPIHVIISPDETFLEKYLPLLNEPAQAAVPGGLSGGGDLSPAASMGGFDVSGGGSQAAVAANTFSSKAPKINVDMLLDVVLDISIELGRTEIAIKRVLDMAPGTLIELDRSVGEPVELLVNNKVVAKAEVVVIDENFGVRIMSLVSPEERIKSLR